MNEVNEGYLKKTLILLTVSCRVLLLLSVWAIHRGAYPTTDEEFQRMWASILPLTALYGAFFFSYIRFYRRYFFPGERISMSYLIFSCLPVLLLHVAELFLILKKGWLFQTDILNDMDTLYTWLAVLESGLAVYAGFFMSSIFVGKKHVN